jgi:hypothetical protein
VIAWCVLGGCSTNPDRRTASAPPSAATEPAPVPTRATQCPTGNFVYLGYEGSGMPSQALVHQVRRRFPDAIVVVVEPGKLGVITKESYSMEARGRHEAAGREVGWNGNTVDFPVLQADCSLSFRMPVPQPQPTPTP